MSSSENQINWSAPEFVHYPKSKWWFAAVSLIGLSLIGYFIWQKDYFTVVLFGLLFTTVLFFSRLSPRVIHIEIDNRGIKLNQNRLPFEQIKSFWIVYEPPLVKTLNLETAARFNSSLTLQLMNEDPIKIRDFLLHYIPENLDRGEQFSDKLARTLKF